MKTQDLAIAAGVFGGVALLVMKARGAGPFSGDAERMSGVSHLYATNAAQQQLTNAAIAQNWKDTFSQIDATQPDWWI